jgi:hypothetical protein
MCAGPLIGPHVSVLQGPSSDTRHTEQGARNCCCASLRRTLFLLMQHQDVAARLVKEVDSVVGDAPPGQQRIMSCSAPKQNALCQLLVVTPSDVHPQS